MLRYRVSSERKGGNGVEVSMHFLSRVQAQEAGRLEAKNGFGAKLWMVQEAEIEEFSPSIVPVPASVAEGEEKNA